MKRTLSASGKQWGRQQSVTSVMPSYSIIMYSGGVVLLVMFLFSCSSIPLTQRDAPVEEERAAPLRYSMVFVIHGDGNYLYHDSRGNARRADEETLADAIGVAKRNPQAEVFIFHQRAQRHILYFFPRPEGKFFYYRYGQLIAEESFKRDKGVGISRLDSEAALYHRYKAKGQAQLMRFFLYFGHEIPEISSGAGYHTSYPEKGFTIHDFANGLNQFTFGAGKFDLLVLSTCFGGTPYTVAALAPYTQTIVASPGNLHLSYFDLNPFVALDMEWSDGDVAQFAENFARQAFDRLTEDVQTAVSVAVYDVDRAQAYLDTVNHFYDNTLTTMQGQAPESYEHCDCTEDSRFVLPGMSAGVEVFYRPSRFGRTKHKQSHSGWECWERKNE